MQRTTSSRDAIQIVSNRLGGGASAIRMGQTDIDVDPDADPGQFCY